MLHEVLLSTQPQSDSLCKRADIYSLLILEKPDAQDTVELPRTMRACAMSYGALIYDTIFAGIFFLTLFGGCGKWASDTNMSSSEGQTSKPLPPIDVSLTIQGQLAPGVAIPFTFAFTPKRAVQHAVVQIEAIGAVSVDSLPVWEWDSLGVDTTLTTQGTLQIKHVGEGTLKASVEVITTDSWHFGRSSVVYFLITEKEVLTNTYSTLMLRLTHLENRFKAGEMTYLTYVKAREKLLGGGALENNTPPK